MNNEILEAARRSIITKAPSGQTDYFRATWSAEDFAIGPEFNAGEPMFFGLNTLVAKEYAKDKARKRAKQSNIPRIDIPALAMFYPVREYKLKREVNLMYFATNEAVKVWALVLKGTTTIKWSDAWALFPLGEDKALSADMTNEVFHYRPEELFTKYLPERTSFYGEQETFFKPLLDEVRRRHVELKLPLIDGYQAERLEYTRVNHMDKTPWHAECCFAWDALEITRQGRWQKSALLEEIPKLGKFQMLREKLTPRPKEKKTIEVSHDLRAKNSAAKNALAGLFGGR